MEKSVFRQSSLERISSPEQLNDYIKVSSPGVWLIIAAMLILVASLFVWGITGDIPTTYTVTGDANGGSILCYFSPEDAAALRAGMEVRVGEVSGTLDSISPMPLSYAETASRYNSDYTIHSLQLSDWNSCVTISADVPDGLHEVTIIAETVKPLSFLMN